MTGDDRQKFDSIFARTLQIPLQDVTDEMTLRTVPSWDSFNALMLISELETGFGVQLGMDEVSKIQSVRDLKAALKSKGADL